MEINHPEIQSLKSLQRNHRIKASSIDPPIADAPFKIEFQIQSQSWDIYIVDEYGDFNFKNQLVCIFLTLRALEDYQDGTDFLAWCKNNGISASEGKWLAYYKDLAVIYDEVRTELGEIDSYISSLDYQLRSGAYHALLTSNSTTGN